jgi:hypothetical protein
MENMPLCDGDEGLHCSHNKVVRSDPQVASKSTRSYGSILLMPGFHDTRPVRLREVPV